MKMSDLGTVSFNGLMADNIEGSGLKISSMVSASLNQLTPMENLASKSMLSGTKE